MEGKGLERSAEETEKGNADKKRRKGGWAGLKPCKRNWRNVDKFYLAVHTICVATTMALFCRQIIPASPSSNKKRRRRRKGGER